MSLLSINITSPEELIGNISKTHFLIIIIVITLVFLTYYKVILPIYQAWKMDNKNKLRLSKEKTKRSKEKTKRRRISIKPKPTERNFYGISMKMDSSINKRIKRLDDKYDGVTREEFMVNIAKNEHPNAESVQDRLDGNYLILTVDSGNVRKGFRITARNVESGNEIKVVIPTDKLSDYQLAHLQNSEWSKSELYMQINIERIEDRIHSATLVCVKLPDDT